MKKDDRDNELNTAGKYNNHLSCDPFKMRGDISVSDYQPRRNVTLNNIKEERDSGNPMNQYRYIVTLFGFFAYVQFNCFRIGTSMSVVKMVNNTAVNFKKNFNGTVDSCPLNNSTITGFIEPSAEGEFNWDPQIQGYILSAGFLGNVVSQIPGSYIAEAYGAKNTLFSGVLISSLAHILSPFAAWYSSYLLIAMQLLRGLGQGFMTPACSVIAAKWFPRPERGFLNSCIFQGYTVGSLTAYAISGVLCSSPLFGGWPLIFFVYGGLALVFGLCVHLFLYESPKEHPTLAKAELIYILQNQESDLSQKRPPTPWRKILTSVPVYAVTFSIFAVLWAMSQQMAAHPIFLANILHFPIQTNGLLNSIPYALEIVVIFLGGWVSKWLNIHGYVGVDKVRKGCTMLYCLGYSVSLLGTYFAGCNRVWSNVCSILGFAMSGLAIPGCVVVLADMSPTFAGSLFAFSNTVACSATFILPVIVGAMIDAEESLEQWRKIFIICIAVVMSSGIVFCIFGSAEVQPWNFPQTDIDRNRTKEEVVKDENKEYTLTEETSTHL